MKAILALFFLGAASAAVVPLTYTTTGVIPYTAGSAFVQPTAFLPYSSGFVSDPVRVVSGPVRVIPYSTAPQTFIPAVAPVAKAAVAPGYIAKTLGSEHIAPLPAGHSYASHHINLAKAPGTV